jgi:hypothetical protein
MALGTEDVPPKFSDMPSVIKRGWMENPRSKWRCIAEKIIYFDGVDFPANQQLICRSQPHKYRTTCGR